MATKTIPYSNLKIFHHGELLKSTERGEQSAPLYIRIKPTNMCNENCRYCHYKNPYLTLDEYAGHDFIPRDTMVQIIKDLGDIGVKAVTFSGGGEPLLYPYIDETMRRVLERNMDLSMITNGVLLKEQSADLLSGAKWVRVSIDAADDHLYSKFRGVPEGEFTKLCGNLRHFAKIKNKDCELGVNFVVGKENHRQIYAIAELMKSLGVDHIKFAPVISNDTEAYHRAIYGAVAEQMQKAKDELEDAAFRIVDLYTGDFSGGQFEKKIFVRDYETCYIKNYVCVIAANAKVYYCHNKSYMSDGCIGDLCTQSFSKLWFSENTIRKFKEFNAQAQCRHRCVYDERNKLLNAYFSMDKNHLNFI